MTEQQIELYRQTMERMHRMGKNTTTDVIVALAEEIEYYRKKIRAMEKFI